MYNTTYNNIQKERQLDRAEEEVGTGRCIQHTTIYRKSDSQIERRRRYVQVDVYNILQYIERAIVRQRGRGGRYRQMDTTYNNRQIDKEIVYGEEGEVGIDRYIQHRTIDRQRDNLSHRTKDRQRVSQIKRGRRQEQQRDVYNIEQYKVRAIDRQRGGGGGRYRQM